MNKNYNYFLLVTLLFAPTLLQSMNGLPNPSWHPTDWEISPFLLETEQGRYWIPGSSVRRQEQVSLNTLLSILNNIPELQDTLMFDIISQEDLRTALQQAIESDNQEAIKLLNQKLDLFKE